jgi:glycosyltransferase involved in cell wall biosynthesis
MSRLRVLSFGSVPPEWGGGRRGGVATFHATLIESVQADAECPVEVVGIVSLGSGEGSAPVPVRILEKGQRREEFLRAVVEELRPDVALLNHFSTSWGLTLPTVAPELPLIGIAHSWHPVTHAQDPEVAHERMQRAMDGLAALVVPSEHCLREGRSLGLRYPERTHVVRYPLPRHFAEPVDLDQPRAGVVFAGELIARKNPAALLEAASSLPGLLLTIVGEGAEQADLETMAVSLGIGGRVQFAGSVGPEAMRSAMSRAEVFCLPSLSESFGIVYIEALACGTPVIGFAPTFREIEAASGVELGVGLPQATKEEIAAAIEHVRAREWDRAGLRRAVLDAYSARAIATDYANVLVSAAGRA